MLSASWVKPQGNACWFWKVNSHGMCWGNKQGRKPPQDESILKPLFNQPEELLWISGLETSLLQTLCSGGGREVTSPVTKKSNIFSPLGSGSGRAEIMPSRSCSCLAKPVCSHRPDLRAALSQVARSTQTLLPLWCLLMVTSILCPSQGRSHLW